MRVAIIWIIWLALVVWWLSPEVDDIRDNVKNNYENIKKTIMDSNILKLIEYEI